MQTPAPLPVSFKKITDMKQTAEIINIWSPYLILNLQNTSIYSQNNTLGLVMLILTSISTYLPCFVNLISLDNHSKFSLF